MPDIVYTHTFKIALALARQLMNAEGSRASVPNADDKEVLSNFTAILCFCLTFALVAAHTLRSDGIADGG